MRPAMDSASLTSNKTIPTSHSAENISSIVLVMQATDDAREAALHPILFLRISDTFKQGFKRHRRETGYCLFYLYDA